MVETVCPEIDALTNPQSTVPQKLASADTGSGCSSSRFQTVLAHVVGVRRGSGPDTDIAVPGAASVGNPGSQCSSR